MVIYTLKDAYERIMKLTFLDTKTGCWIFTGPKLDGRGRIYLQFTHRIIYENLVEEIPKNMTIDHLCKIKACINPFHLEPVSISINSKRKKGMTYENIKRKKEMLYVKP